MNLRTLIDVLTNRRGVALPMALLTLLVLSVLIIGFSVLSASEPTIANNQLMVARARAIGESGLERAVWALYNKADANGIPTFAGGTAPAPYDGSVLIMVPVGGANVGGFRVTVTNGGAGCAAANERCITVDSWVPNDTANPRAKQKIVVTVSQFLFAGSPPPAGLTVRGEIGAGGHAEIDSTSDPTSPPCPPRPGSWSKGATTISGSATITGALDGNSTPNQTVGPLADVRQNVPDASFNAYTLTNNDLNALKALAKKNGTYYQGTISFNSSNQMPNGLIYVDTVSGNNIDVAADGTPAPNTTPTSDFASVDIHGNAPADASGIFTGLLFVAGGLSISGNFQMHGLVYAQNDFTYLGTGTGQIDGAVISQNVRDTSTTSIDTTAGGNSLIRWNCGYAEHPWGTTDPPFLPVPGTYKEVAG
jgi:Tfp pilus assembly protein PilX